MQNTFSQSGNDSKWFLRKIIFQNRYVALETPSEPPSPFMANTILNFHFDYLNPFLSGSAQVEITHFKKRASLDVSVTVARIYEKVIFWRIALWENNLLGAGTQRIP